MDKLELINNLIVQVDALADARGALKCKLIVDTINQLNALKEMIQAPAPEPDDPDGETIDGKFYPYGGGGK